MNTDKFDQHAKNNLAFYNKALQCAKYVIAFTVILLAFLAWAFV